MSNFDLFSMGIKNLLRRKTRTILTVLGVIIGTSSIVVMLSLGIGMNLTFQAQLESMGSLNVIEVSSGGRYMMEESASSVSEEARLDDQSLRSIEGINHVEAVLASKQIYGEVIAGRYRGSFPIIGVDVEKLSTFDIEIAEGRFPLATGKNEVIFGANIKDQFYNPKSRNSWEDQIVVDPLTAKLVFKTYDNSGGSDPNYQDKGTSLNGVGIMTETQDQSDWSAYMDFDALEKIQNSGHTERVRSRDQVDGKYDNFKVKVDDIKNVAEVQEQIKGMGFQAWSLVDILDSMKKTSAGIQAVLGGIGAVSLFVAALGITNTMIMSIYERTKEIGVMKVIGARLKDIKRLFLFEAGLIGFFGGLFGIIMSYGISKIINFVGGNMMGNMMGVETKISVIPIWLVLLALAFSSIVGIVSGYYPARRAMMLSALDAIRGEQ